jgi:hypothetical protein
MMSARTVQIARSIGVLGATGALVFGVTFAAVGDHATAALSGNTLSATAGLQIAIDSGGTAGAYATSVTGFQLTDLRFGVERKAGGFWLKNTAVTDQSVVVTVPTPPVVTGSVPGKVHVRITKGATTVLSTTLDQLETVSGVAFAANSLAGPAELYGVYYTLDAPTGTGSSVSVPTFDLNFTGTELAAPAAI